MTRGVTVPEFVSRGVPRHDAVTIRDEAVTLAVLAVRDGQLSEQAAIKHMVKLAVRLALLAGAR